VLSGTAELGVDPSPRTYKTCRHPLKLGFDVVCLKFGPIAMSPQGIYILRSLAGKEKQNVDQIELSLVGSYQCT
jgi:hypothetical protein